MKILWYIKKTGNTALCGGYNLEQNSQPGKTLPPKGLWQCLQTFIVVTTRGGVTAIYWLKVRDAALLATVYPRDTPLTPHKRSAQNATSAQAEKSCFGHLFIYIGTKWHHQLEKVKKENNPCLYVFFQAMENRRDIFLPQKSKVEIFPVHFCVII